MALNYQLKGQGPCLVLIHGFCEDLTLWKVFEDKLSDHFQVLSLDLPGFGKSNPIKDMNIESFAEEVKILLDELRITKCTMIGHSLGGYVTLAFAEHYEMHLDGIGLFHSTAFADTKEKKENRNKTIAFLERNGMEPFATSFVPPLFYPKYRKNLQGSIDALIETAKKTSLNTVLTVTKAMRDRKERVDVLKELNIPVLYIVGKEDNAVPLKSSLEQCYLPKQSIAHFLSETGHMGMIEKEEETIKIVKTFTQLCNE